MYERRDEVVCRRMKEREMEEIYDGRKRPIVTLYF